MVSTRVGVVTGANKGIGYAIGQSPHPTRYHTTHLRHTQNLTILPPSSSSPTSAPIPNFPLEHQRQNPAPNLPNITRPHKRPKRSNHPHHHRRTPPKSQSPPLPRRSNKHRIPRSRHRLLRKHPGLLDLPRRNPPGGNRFRNQQRRDGHGWFRSQRGKDDAEM